MKDIINNLQRSDTWKIQLTVAIKFMSSKDNNDERVIHSKSDNKDIMSHNKADEVTEQLFLNFFFLDIRLVWKHQRKVVISFLIVRLLLYK